ncbi:MAG TPA: type IX secretion system membrane protein PorP/SprF [Bacteroidales bacterium]|nr:type IX secretion system membrane protein PorP/SprF [Bacteroidales bacterium]HSA43910.1 type IX secretion system membrane protein PorP/SprF [Bacteroidales bacterium]
MKKVFGALLLFSFMGVTLHAQQEAQFTQYMFNNMSINPAFAGSNEAICFTGLARQQWFGIKEGGDNVAPRTFLVSLDAPVNILHGGLGATVFQDQLGFEKNVGLRLNYAYRFNLGNGMLSFGAQAGFLNKTIDFSKFRPLDEGDPVLVSSSKESNFTTDFGFGAFYKLPGKFHVGLSAIQLTGAKQPIGKAEYSNKQHIFVTAGYEYTLPDNPEFEILPSLLVKTDGAAAQYDVTAMLRYNNKFWGGVSYRVQDAIAILMGMHVKNFRIGYSYDITTSKLTKAGSTGSHEIMAGYCFKIIIEKPRKSYRNTRFL